MFVIIFGSASAVVVAIGTINNAVKTKCMRHKPAVCMHCDFHGNKPYINSCAACLHMAGGVACNTGLSNTVKTNM
jgi:hypothetical protein